MCMCVFGRVCVWKVNILVPMCTCNKEHSHAFEWRESTCSNKTSCQKKRGAIQQSVKSFYNTDSIAIFQFFFISDTTRQFGQGSNQHCSRFVFHSLASFKTKCLALFFFSPPSYEEICWNIKDDDKDEIQKHTYTDILGIKESRWAIRGVSNMTELKRKTKRWSWREKSGNWNYVHLPECCA